MLESNEKYVTKYNYLEEKFAIAYKWLKETDISAIPVSVIPLTEDPKEVYAQVQEYTTAPWEEIKFEAHDRYFDIHYMVRGDEVIGVCDRDGLVQTESIPDNDMLYFREPEHASSIYLKEGDMLVVAPEDAHKPRCCVSAPLDVKKVVVKVRV